MIKSIKCAELSKDIPQPFLTFMMSGQTPYLLEEESMKTTGLAPQLFYQAETLHPFIHSEDLEKFEAFYRSAFDISPIHIAYKLLNAEGNYIQIFHRRINFSHGKAGKKMQLHTLTMEKATHIWADEKHIGDNNWCENLINSLNNIIFQTDINGNWSFLNDSWVRIMEYEVEEVLGKPLFQYLHPDDVKKNFNLFEPLLDGTKPFCIHEVRYITKYKRVIWMRVYAILVKDDFNRTIGASGTLQDITQEVKNRNLVELLSNTITDLICVIGIDGAYQYVSASSKTTTGYSPEELLGKRPTEFIHKDDLKNIEPVLQNNESNEEIYTTYRFLTKNGNYKWFETSSKTIRDENDMPLGIATATRVVDQKKKAEDLVLASLEKERELNNLKSNFVSLASHEFRTPLACIRSSVELLEITASRTKEMNPSIIKHTNNIYLEVDRLSELIDEILTVGKIDSNTLSCKPEKVNMPEFIREIITNIEKTQDTGRRIVFKIQGIFRYVMADSLLLNHSITNLISNALKYSEGKPPPVVRLIFNKNNYQIKIRDFGIGIPAADKNKIYQAFYRAENAYEIEGTGLGMFITKKFIELHNGTISFESLPSDGTEFTVKLT